ncbi:hypothetical protein ACFPRA_00705 [Sporosarcina soli]|uniref:Uncharacterized protein n=1 Tax=Sporosarcina soli TaxID=334736 RepID=A0ABW0TDN0_9BACL
MLKQIQLNYPEFNGVMKNLQLKIVNSGMVVTPDLIKKALVNSEIQ